MSQEEVLNKIFMNYRDIELVFSQIIEIAKIKNIQLNNISLHHACEKLAKNGELYKRNVRGEKFYIIYNDKEICKTIRKGFAYCYTNNIKNIKKPPIVIKVKNK